MSEEEQKPEVSGFLRYPAPEDVQAGASQPPRQPHNLQGLLRFAMEATKSEDAPNESRYPDMDEERKQFLEQALKSMTIDVIEILMKNVKTLSNANSLPVDGDITDSINAFETILDYVDDIDTAIDFHKIGGFTVIPPCLNSVHPAIRAQACNLLAELCQNNPYCQNVVLENDILPVVMSLLEDINEEVCVKALYAVSCTIRENEKGYKQFRNLDGLNVILKTMQKPIEKLRTKSSFLLSSLIHTDNSLKDELCKMDAISVLLCLISGERMPSHEHLLSLLLFLVTDNANAVRQCQESKYNLKCVLSDYHDSVRDKEECTTESQLCLDLLKAIFPPDINDMDR